MDNQLFIDICKDQVVKFFNDVRDKSDSEPITTDNVYVVWLCKTLQNNKCLISTTVSDGMYYELTYNGDKEQLYLDAYKKIVNMCIDL